VFRQKRDDTLISNIEKMYRLDFRARGDMRLGNLLDERGFESLSQFLDAYRGRLGSHARTRRVFISFHKEDRGQVAGFRLMAHNPNVDIDFYDGSLKERIDSESRSYVKRVIKDMINRCSVVVCLIGNGTAWREWVDWELATALELRKGLCGVRIRETYGRTPNVLRRLGAPVAEWVPEEIIRAIECAAARRS
jgi:antiphage defense system Thoeris ThsB-like protein